MLGQFAILTAFTVINMFSLAYYFNHPVRTPVRQAVQFIAQNFSPSQTILVKGYFYDHRLFEYYRDRYGIKTPAEFSERKESFEPEQYDWIVSINFPLSADPRLTLTKRIGGVGIYHPNKTKNP